LIEFAEPELILLLPFLIALTMMSHHFAQKIKRSLEVFHYPPVERLIRVAVRRSIRRQSWRGISLMLKITVVVVITFSFSGPSILIAREVVAEIPVVAEKDVVPGIILAIDVSPSMGIRDIVPSRFEATRDMVIELIEESSEKVRFGIVAFEDKVENSLPLTMDRELAVHILEDLTVAPGLPCIEEFTDIGYALGTAIELLTPYNTSRGAYPIILLSDGFANYGYPDPLASVTLAAEEANERNIPIYTVHVARMGLDSNPTLLEQIAEKTNGKFMRSTSVEELRNVLATLAKYHTPTNACNASVKRVAIPQRIDLGNMLMLVAALFILTIWIGNYRHYKTWF